MAKILLPKDIAKLSYQERIEMQEQKIQEALDRQHAIGERIIQYAEKAGQKDRFMKEMIDKAGVIDHYSDTKIHSGRNAIDVIKQSIRMNQTDDKYVESGKQIAESLTIEAMKEVHEARIEKAGKHNNPDELEQAQNLNAKEKQLYDYQKEVMDHAKDPQQNERPALSKDWSLQLSNHIIDETLKEMDVMHKPMAVVRLFYWIIHFF